MTLYIPPPGTPTRDNVVSLLKARFPDFWKERNSDDLSDGLPEPYPVFADFSRWMICKMEQAVEDTQVSDIFDFLEELLIKGEHYIPGLLAMTVAEKLADNFSNLDAFPIGERMSALIKAERFPL